MNPNDIRVSWVLINNVWHPVNGPDWDWSEQHREWVPRKKDGWEWHEKKRIWVQK